MRHFKLITLAFLALLLSLGATLRASAQDEAEEKSRLIEFVENKISTDNRQIRLNGIQGTLSSNVNFDSITIADEDGVWLRIVNPQLVWSRRALLTGRLQIDSLTAERIEWPRLPAPADGAPAPESSGFSIPELPVAVNIDELAIDEAEFGEAVFGLASTLRLNGSLNLSGGNLATNLQIERLDGPGGELALDATYDGGSEELDLDFSLQEPEDGIVANLLNIPDRPDVSLQIQGSGPVNDLEIDLQFDAGGERIADGTLALNDALQSGDRRILLDLAGPIQKILPEQHRAFFGGETSLQADVTMQEGGGTLLDSIQLNSGALDIAASGTLLADGFPAELTADINLGSGNGEPVRLPLPGDPVTIGGGELDLRYRTDGVEGWSLTGRFDDFATTGIEIGQVELDGGGDVRDPQDPEQRYVSFDLTGGASGISPEDEGIARAIGDAITFDANGEWQAGEPVTLANATISADTLRAVAQGIIEEMTFKGTASVEASNLAAFSLLADRTLGGSTSLEIDGDIGFGGAFDLQLSGSLTDAEVDNDIANRLLEGQTTLSGGAARSTDGLTFNDLRLQNPQFNVVVDGAYATGQADLTAEAVLNDIANLSEQANGRLSLQANISKPEGSDRNTPYSVDANLQLAEGELMDRNVPSARLAFSGQLNGGDVAGNVDGSGQIDGETIDISGQIDRNADRIAISDFVARIGLTELAANLLIVDGLADGEIRVDSNDISAVAALALADASGAVNGTIQLSSEQGQQDADVDITVSGLRYQENRIGQADIQAAIADLKGQPLIDADIDGSGIEAAGVKITTLSATATSEGDGTQFEADATLENGTDAEVAGRYQAAEDGFTAELDKLNVQSSYGDVRLTRQATITRAGDTTTIESVEAEVAGGTISASGSIGETMDLRADLSEIPLSIVNSFRPDLGVGGTLNGSVDVSGTADNPQAEFTIRGSDLTANALQSASIAPIQLEAEGSYADKTIRLANFSARNSQNLNVTGSGSIPLPGASGGQMDLDANINALPLAIANGFRPELGLGGTLDGAVNASGTLDNPRAQFTLQVSSLDAAALNSAGVAPINATASGSYQGQTIQLSSFSARNAQNLDISASGTIPLSGNGLAVSVNGSAPLSIGESFLASRGTRLDGTLRLDARVTGAISSPSFDGLFSLSGASVTDPLTNVRLSGINGMAGLRGDTISINQLSAQLSGGGSISIGGTIGLAGPLPADLTIRLQNAVYTDARTFKTNASGTLTVTGGLRAGPLLAGTIDLTDTEITVPETLAGDADLLPVEHINPDAGTLQTLQRIRAVMPDDGGSGPSAPVRLDVTVRSPNQIFVRGRGIDAEFGGTVQVRGALDNLQPVGAFNLIRGRLSILNERIELTEGSVTLTGSLDPLINIRAQVEGDDITAYVQLSGRASDLSLVLSSSPDLPQDEILARIIFGKSLSELSPLQIANLATAVASLAGGGSGAGLTEQLRQGIGVDDLDVVQDSEGNVAVKAGKYIQDNVYLDVQAGAGGGEVSINLDVTDSLTAKGSVGTDGNSKLGIFFEKDY